MAVSLSKGQKVDLTKNNPGLAKVVVGLGWDTNKYDGGNDFDLDSSVFLLAENGKVASESDFIFYNNPKGGNGAVVHTGDKRTWSGGGREAQSKIELYKSSRGGGSARAGGRRQRPYAGEPRLQACPDAIVRSMAPQRTDDPRHAIALYFPSHPVTPPLPACN